ncbi:selenide, water dikinase SelD [Microbulbifer agarilyticus]|uniref:selenide, water dikinase SelD n=1 Tax=Microbulbifer agarilyticus TaxID=260552 RepID=UPI001CD61F4A|nr:selenide, water dikinase SelD [Microbulbifer agarilyticus]MCA0894561.1 selenide, water dikinase SelD [Microbulbifer agarilyticus]
MQKQTHCQDLVLIGGGHSHLVLLQQWAKQPLPGVRLTLVSPQVQSPYSPMVPGLIAGHYSHSDIHIDLPRLCRAAGARFIHACAHNIDPLENRVSLLGRPDLAFDFLSLAVGASPCHDIPGSELAVPVKPIGQFYRYWEQLKQQIQRKHQPLKLGIIGGGAGGCELAMAIACALEEPLYSGRVELYLVQSGRKIPADFPLLARRLAAREMSRLKIHAHTNWRVTEITSRGIYSDEGRFLALDKAMLCTESSAPPWLAQSGLAIDEHGFVQVDDYLRSISHPHIFAAGDVAATSAPQPKSSQAAQQQGPTLFHNVRAALQDTPLQAYRPRPSRLQRLSCGSQHAIATFSGLAAVSALFWHAKDRADRRFVDQVNHLPLSRFVRSGNVHAQNVEGENVLGDGALGVDLFDQALARLAQPVPKKASEETAIDRARSIALTTATSALELPSDKLLVQHTEQLCAPVQDPWLFGRLAAQHSLSHLFAVQAEPFSAQALVTLPTQLPNASPALASRDLQLILDGAARELNQYDCSLTGGQLLEGPAAQIGLTLNGSGDRASLAARNSVRAGDCLILTKPLGNGALFAAQAQGKAHARWLQQALDTMLQSNLTAANIFMRNGVRAMTSVHRAGLLGQILEMLHWHPQPVDGATQPAELSTLAVSVLTDALPFLTGATYCAEHAVLSYLHQHNARSYKAVQNPGFWQGKPHLPMLVDPQICGGLLGSVPAEHAEQCISALHAAGWRHAAVIGVVDTLTTENDAHAQTSAQPIYLATGSDWKKLAANRATVAL